MLYYLFKIITMKLTYEYNHEVQNKNPRFQMIYDMIK